MANVIRVALPSINALTETDPSKFSLYSDSDNVLIKEFARGAGSVDLSSSITISHNLGYIPFFLVYVEIDTDRFRLLNAQSPIGGGWTAYATINSLVITNNFSSTHKEYQYYIFYDNIT